MIKADAGEIIATFGQSVGDSPAVGFVVSIVTVVQFIAISCSERVAAKSRPDFLMQRPVNIAHYFLKAGIIDDAAQTAKRTGAAARCSFDGAMKFIKGDAIAGIAG